MKTDSFDQLRNDIDEDPKKNSIAEVGALLVETFGRFLAPLIVLAHTANRSVGFVKSSDHTQVSENE